MDPSRFDAITRSLGAARSRRSVFRILGTAALGAIGLAGASRQADAAPGGNSACAAFCAAVFGDTKEAGQCTSQAAHGQGLCYECGPASSDSLTLCGTTCIPACAPLDQCHVAGTCDPTTGHCTNPTVGNGISCTPAGGGTGTCQGGNCVTCTADGDTCSAPSECCSGNCFNGHCAEFVTTCGMSSCAPGTLGCAGNKCCGAPAYFSCVSGDDTECCGLPATHCAGGFCTA